jgi:hypothetical protein
LSRLLFATLFLGTVLGHAQTAQMLERLTQRLDSLERQNSELLDEVRLLRAELESIKRSASAPTPRLDALEEQMQLQAGRIAEQDQIKVQGVHRTPVRLTGLVLFNAGLNGRHGSATMDYPPVASLSAVPVRGSARLAQSVFGLEFESPQAVLGGRFRGSFTMDLSGMADSGPTNTLVRLRTASIEGQWKSRSILVGQERPIFAPREPNSLARVDISPLASAGNLWMWRPQFRFEQKIALGSAQELRAQVGVTQTREDQGLIPAQAAGRMDLRRPAFEGNFRFTHRIDDFRRVEIAHGLHWSTTHVAGGSVPSNVYSVDWFVNPIRRIEFTGFLFTGENLAKHGGLAGVPSFILQAARPGETRLLAVRGRGGWAQLTWIATPRLSFNLFSGRQDSPDRTGFDSTIRFRNWVNGVNFFYKLATNVVTGIETSRVRTWYVGGQHPLNNHYDLYVAYLF